MHHSIPDDELDIFCKNVYNVQVINTRSLAEERSSPASEAVMMALVEPFEDEHQTPILWYLALRAADTFNVSVCVCHLGGVAVNCMVRSAVIAGITAQMGRYPGTEDSQLQNDVDAVWSAIQVLVAEYGQEAPVTVAHSQEMYVL